MLKQVRTHSATLFEWWVGFVGHHAPLVLLITFLVTVGVLAFTVGHFRIDMDMSNMISEKLPYRKLDKELDRAFPQLGNTILVVLDGDTPEATRAYAKMLVERLDKEKGLFKKVYWPGGEEFFKRSGLLYLKVSELRNFLTISRVPNPSWASCRKTSASVASSLLSKSL